MSELKDIISLKGLESVTSEENPDYQMWYEGNKEAFYDLRPSEIREIYLNKLFSETFENGDNMLKTLSPKERDLYFENYYLDSHFKENYANDPNLNTILSLTPEGKRQLLNNRYLSPEEMDAAKKADELLGEKAKIKDDQNWFLKMMTSASIDPMTSSPSFKEYTNTSIDSYTKKGEEAREENNKLTLDKVIEEDKERQKEFVKDDILAIKENLHYGLSTGQITNEDIDNEFKKIAEGYDITISNDELGEETIHIPGSNYFKAFKDTKWLNDLSQEDKINYISEHQAITNTFGLNNALYALDSDIQNRVADNQTFVRKTWNTASGVVQDTGAVIAQTALFLGYGMWLSKEKQNLWLQGLDENGERLADAFNVQYWSKAQEYDTWNSNIIAEADAAGGISRKNTAWSKEQENRLISAKTIADVTGQLVWMASSMGVGAITKGLGMVASKGLATLANTARGLSTSTKVIKGIDYTEDALKVLGRFTKVGIDAANVAFAEGTDAYNTTRENLHATINSNLETEAQKKTAEDLKELQYQKLIDERTYELIDEFIKEYPKVKPEDIDLNAFKEQATDEITTLLNKKNIEELSPSYDDAREKADIGAVDAFRFTTAVSTMKTGMANVSLKRFMYDTSFRKNFGIEAPNIGTRITKEGLLEVIEPSVYTKFIEPIGRNVILDGFVDELFDGVIRFGGIGYGTEKFMRYYNNPNEGYGGFNSIMAGFGNAILNGSKGFVDEGNLREAFIGLLSGGILTTPRFVFKKAPKGYSFLEKVNFHFANPILNDIMEINAEYAATKERVTNINNLLKKYSDSISDVGKLMQSIGDLSKAQLFGNDIQTLTARNKAAIDLMFNIENLAADPMTADSPIAKDLMTTIEQAAEGNISDDEVRSFLSSVENKHLKDKMSPEEVKSRIQENAIKLLYIKDAIDLKRKDFSSYTTFKRASKYTQDAIISNQLMLESFDDRIHAIEKELGLPATKYKSTFINSAVTIGSRKHLDIHIKSIDESIEELQKLKTKIKESNKHNINKVDKRLNQDLLKSSKKEYLKELDDRIEELKFEKGRLLADNDTINYDEKGFNTKVLSKEEILALDITALGHMLNSKNRSLYSEDQLKVIDEVAKSLNNTVISSNLANTQKPSEGGSYYIKVIEELKNNRSILANYIHTYLRYGDDHLGISEDMDINNIGSRNTHLTSNLIFNEWDNKYINLDTKELEIDKLSKTIFDNPAELVKEYLDKKGDLIDQGIKDLIVYKTQLWNDFVGVVATSELSNKEKQELIFSILPNFSIIDLSGDLAVTQKEFESLLKDVIEDFLSVNNTKAADNLINISKMLSELGHIKEVTVQRDKKEEEKKKKQREEEKKRREEESKKRLEEKKKEEKDKEEEKNRKQDEEDNSTLKPNEKLVSESYDVLEEDDAGDSSIERDLKESNPNNVKVTTINDPTLLDPVEDSLLPDDADSSREVLEYQGNAIYLYEGDPLRNDVKQVERVGKEENDTRNSLFKWLKTRKIKLQEIIDNELAAIADTDPDIKFMMLTKEEYGDLNLGHTIFQVIDYTEEIKSIHNEERGGVIVKDGKSYLIIGVCGYSKNNSLAEQNYIGLLNKIKAGRANEKGYYIYPHAHTKIKTIQSGWVVKQTIDDSSEKMRNVKELFEDPKRNPHNLSLRRAKWFIQEKTTAIEVGIEDSDVLHTPLNIEANNGALFLMVPSANGHLIPLSIKISLAKELPEISNIRDNISNLIAKLGSPVFEERFNAKKELSKLLVISKDGDGIFIDKNSRVVTVTRKGETIAKISMTDKDATHRLENAIVGPDSTFKLNINRAILGDDIDTYIEEGVIQTDAALLGTSNASYTVYAIDEFGEPIIEEETKVNNFSNSVSTSDYISAKTGKVEYLNNSYTTSDGLEFYDNEGNKIEDVEKITELKTAYWLAKHPEITPARVEKNVSIYILSYNTENPKAISVINSTGRISVLSKKAAIHEILKVKNKTTAEKQQKETKTKLLELDTLEEDDYTSNKIDNTQETPTYDSSDSAASINKEEGSTSKSQQIKVEKEQIAISGSTGNFVDNTIGNQTRWLGGKNTSVKRDASELFAEEAKKQNKKSDYRSIAHNPKQEDVILHSSDTILITEFTNEFSPKERNSKNQLKSLVIGTGRGDALAIKFGRPLTDEEFKKASDFIWKEGVSISNWNDFVEGLVNSINSVDDSNKKEKSKKDDSILSDGVAKVTNDEQIKTSDFMTSPEFPFTTELVQKLIDLGVAELQGEQLNDALDKLNIPTFINPNNENEVNDLIKTILNCRG